MTSLLLSTLLSFQLTIADRPAVELIDARQSQVTTAAEVSPLARKRRNAKNKKKKKNKKGQNKGKQQQLQDRAKALRAYRDCLDKQRARTLAIRQLSVELGKCQAAAAPILDFEQKTAAYQACTDAYNAGVAQYPEIDCSALQRATR